MKSVVTTLVSAFIVGTSFASGAFACDISNEGGCFPVQESVELAQCDMANKEGCFPVQTTILLAQCDINDKSGCFPVKVTG